MAACGSAPRATRRPRWSPSSSTDSSRLDVVLVALALIARGPACSAPIWLRLGVPVRRRVYESVGRRRAHRRGAVRVHVRHGELGHVRRTARTRSRAPTKRALERIREPLRIEAHLAPEDPRRVDLERRALSKLRRVMPWRAGALRVGDVDRPVRADERALRRDLVRAGQPTDDEPAHDGRRRPRDDLCRWPASRSPVEDDERDFSRSSAGGAAERSRGRLLRNLAGAGRGGAHSFIAGGTDVRTRTAGTIVARGDCARCAAAARPTSRSI